MLEKTTRLNLLYDFYQVLLTEKQRHYMELYFQDDYSLGEIAEEFGISRQAVYEHIKRAEVILEDYESKLQLLGKFEDRHRVLNDILQILNDSTDNKSKDIEQKILQLKQID